MTPFQSHRISNKSVEVCHQLGLTGRVFANDVQAFAVTEGETRLVRQYYEAVKTDKMVESIILHVNRPIERREFVDYSVWLNSRETHLRVEHVWRLTGRTLEDALPVNLSAKVRILVEAYLKPELLVH